MATAKKYHVKVRHVSFTENSKIRYIRTIRMLTGWGLKRAKEYADRTFKQERWMYDIELVMRDSQLGQAFAALYKDEQDQGLKEERTYEVRILSVEQINEEAALIDIASEPDDLPF